MSLHMKRILYPLMAVCALAPVCTGVTEVASSHTANASSLSTTIDKYADSRSAEHHPNISWNYRSLGGLPAANGSHIKAGKLFRSSNFESITKSGKRSLSNDDVNQDIDLRYYYGGDGVSGKPDPGEENHAHMSGTSANFEFAPVYSSGEFHGGLKSFYGDPAVTNSKAIKAYKSIFTDLLNNHNGATVYHCNDGRDRTGVVSVLIESALGVSKRNIYKDYLLTYKYKGTGDYSYQKSKLDKFYSTIDTHYGSMKNYLQKGIGLNSRKISQLRKMYLTK